MRLRSAQRGDGGAVRGAEHGVALLRRRARGGGCARVHRTDEQRQRGKSDHDVPPFARRLSHLRPDVTRRAANIAERSDADAKRREARRLDVCPGGEARR